MVIITAASLYEAVALRLVSVRGEDWVAGIPGGLNTVRVSAIRVPVEHSVKLKDFQQWLERQGRTPREVADRSRIRKILGLAEHPK